MGSNKKHKKESRKHRHRSRSRSPARSPETERRKHKKRRRERSEERRDYHSDSSDVVEVIETRPPPKESSKSNRSPSPIPEGGAGDCLSIAETNKLRAKLGLKPLEVDPKPSSKEEKGEKAEKGDDKKLKDDWGEFYHKPAANISELKDAEKIRAKIKERKEKRKLEEQLEKTKTLGESDEDDDINKWVEKNREKEKLKRDAERRAKILQEMDEEFGVNAIVEQQMRDKRRDAYKNKDLKGIRVEHDVSEFTEGKDVILTLKDSGVLDDEGDTLVNVNILDNERYKKNVENKKFRLGTSGYDCYDEEMDEFGAPMGRAVLKKYDDEIKGEKKNSFVIGQNPRQNQEEQKRILEIKCKLENKRLESLSEILIRPAAEYYTEEEISTKFKKPKKQKNKKLRTKLTADDLLPLPGQSKGSDFAIRRRHDSDDEESNKKDEPESKETEIKLEPEEDDLEKVLSKARRLKQKESLITKAVVDIKTEIKEEDSDSEIADNNIILNETAEFCRTLGDIPTYGMAGNRDTDANDMMDLEEGTEEPVEANDVEMEERTGTWNSVRFEEENPEEGSNPSKEVAETTILDEEPDVGAGVAAALRLAMSKGYLEREENNRPSNTRMAHLQAKNYSIEDKSYNEDDKFGRRDRYHSGPVSDFKEKETFKPNVKLEYIDDSGRVLNAKEAFRYLSHKFHGKGPGKNKIEKRLKKNEQEGLMMKMSSTDTPLGTLNMLQAKQKETHSPFIVLSGGKQPMTSSSIVKPKLK